MGLSKKNEHEIFDMKKYIATWVYLDSPEEKSKYPNTGGDSTSPAFQAVYWRCIVLFYETSLRFHKDVHHIFFTNTDTLPTVDGLDIADFFKKNNVEVVPLKNRYPLPQNYFGSFRNQFFEFSIIEYIAKIMEDSDMLILLDSDCVFSKSFQPGFDALSSHEATAMTYVVDYDEKYEIHGLTGEDMRQLSAELGLQLDTLPHYSGGELLFAKGSFFKYVAEDFASLYDDLMIRHKENRLKFNEEAHVLSYYYYRLNSVIGGMDSYIKRMWTNRNYFRNVDKDDHLRTIWHLPNEKRLGIQNLFERIKNGQSLKSMPQEEYTALLKESLLLASNHKLDYYKVFKNSVNKLLRTLKIIGK